jgi:hypothetical protein
MRLVAVFSSLIIGVAILSACNSAEKGLGYRAGGASSVPTPADGVRRVTVQELQSLVANNEAFIVDVRNADSYKTARIKGAKLIPLSEVEKRSNELPKDKLIVFYCS